MTEDRTITEVIFCGVPQPLFVFFLSL